MKEVKEKMNSQFNLDKKVLKTNLHNHTEDIVLDTLEDLLENKNKQFENVCTCDNCLLDMASYALNRLPAKYVSTHKGSLHTKIEEFEQQYQVDIIKVVTQAINIVAENPSPNCKNRS